MARCRLRRKEGERGNGGTHDAMSGDGAVMADTLNAVGLGFCRAGSLAGVVDGLSVVLAAADLVGGRG